jgi:hypothetical protein
MTSSLNIILVLTMVISATILIPFISIHFFLKQIDVLPRDGTVITTSSFRARLWASLLGLTFIGFPAGRVVSAGDAPVVDVLASYSEDWILYTTVFILLIGLIAGMASRRAYYGALAAAIGFLFSAWLGAYMTPETLTLYLQGSMASVELTNLTSSLLVSQLLGGCAGAFLSAMMGAIGGAMMNRQMKELQGSTGSVDLPEGRARLRVTPIPPVDRNGRRKEESMRWSLCPRCGTNLVWLFEERQYHCSNCSGSNDYHSL